MTEKEKLNLKKTAKKMILNNYTLKARIVPAVLTIILPVFIFNHFYTSEDLSKFTGDLFGLKILSNHSISLVFIFLFSQLARTIGKNVFEAWYFNDELKMPTTEILLHSNTQLTPEFRNKIYDKINAKFNVTLSSSVEEKENEQLARRKITEAVSLIRKDLFNNSFLLQHNIEYGAMRNIIGGSVIGVLLLGFNCIFFYSIVPNHTAFLISSLICFLYLLVILFSKLIMNTYGKAYAKIMIREFMGE